MDNIYKLDLHEACKIDEKLIVTRVPGGWVYERQEPQVNLLEMVFVPFNNDFQINSPKSVLEEIEKPANNNKSTPLPESCAKCKFFQQCGAQYATIACLIMLKFR